MVIAAGSVMSEPSNGPAVRTESHQAAVVPPPREASFPMQSSASRSTGREEAMTMMATTKIGSAKLAACV